MGGVLGTLQAAFTSFRIRHDPEEAKRLLAEAGFGPNKPVEAKIIISASGSGQMQTMPGLGSHPAAERMDLAEDGRIVGLF